MIKRHGRILSSALVTALTITNMGGLMPMTALANSEDPTIAWDAPSDVFTGQPFEVGLDWTDGAVTGDHVQINLTATTIVDGGVTTGVKGGPVLTTAGTVKSSAITPTKAGTITFTGQSDTGAESAYVAIEGLDTKTVTVTQAKPTALTAESEYTKMAATGTLSLSATETVNYYTGATDIDWAVYNAEDYAADSTSATAIDNGTFEFSGGEWKPIAGGTTYTEDDVVLTATNATAGAYTIVASAGDETATIPLTVVDLSTHEVKVTDGAYSGAISYTDPDFFPGDTMPLTAYVDGTKSSKVTWSSSDDEVVTVNAGEVTAVAAGTADIIATNKIEDGLTVEGKFRVTVTAPEFTLAFKDGDGDTVEVGKTSTLIAKNGSQTVSPTWKSYNTSVATVNNGVITGVAEGTARIRATYNGEYLEETITVIPKAGPTPPTPVVYSVAGKDGISTIHTGDSLQMLVVDEDDVEYTGSVDWSVTPNTAATISGTGLLKAKTEVGEVTVSATFDVDGEDVTKTAPITIAADGPNFWKVTEDGDHDLVNVDNINYTASMFVNDHMKITALYNGKAVEGDWAVDPTKADKVTVTDKGEITALAAVASVDVTFTTNIDTEGDEDWETLTFAITVEAADLEITSENSNIGDEVEEGATLQLTAMFGVDDVTADSGIKWESTNEATATVDSNKGLVTGVAEGVTTIKATYKVNNTTYEDTFSIEVIAVTDATKEVTEAANAANEAAAKANGAAETAREAARAAETKPTAETVAAAKAAAEAATKAAEVAKAAAEEAEEASEIPGANAEAVKAAIAAADAANDAVTNATTAAATATKAATDAQAKIDEEAKKKAEEDKKNEKAADGSAAGAPAAEGTELVDANGNKTGYKVTDASASSPEVEYEGPADKNATKADIPETQTDLSGNTYKVTSVAAYAFRDTKVTTVTLRKNLKKIDPNAFKKSKVKKVKVKSLKLTKKMAKSFKKLKKGGWIKATGKYKAKNKEILNALPNVKNGKTKVK